MREPEAESSHTPDRTGPTGSGEELGREPHADDRRGAPPGRWDPLPVCLTIAGSDSGAGAGIQADLKTFHALGAYGLTAITSVTAQNTVRVAAVHDLPVEMVRAQLEALFDDFHIHAIKTGMLSSVEITRAVATFLSAHGSIPLVVDPVMVATSGDPLLSDAAVGAIRDVLLPLSTLVTPNRREAEILTEHSVTDLDSSVAAGRRLLEMGAAAALIKGGHGNEDDAIDVLIERDAAKVTRVRELRAPRIATRTTHGTGCTLSAAICAGLARGLSLVDAVTGAKEYVTGAIESGLALGKGHGPTDHFHRFREIGRAP